MSKEVSNVEDNEIFNAKSVVRTLENLMVNVTKDQCDPHTVNAACNCAARITDILRLHLEAQRLKVRKQR